MTVKHSILPLLLAFMSLTASAQLYHDGERLHYTVAYRAQLMPNTEMAVVNVDTDLELLDGKPVYHVVGHGVIMPAFRWFFNIDDRYDIWADADSRRTVRFASDIHEGSYTFDSRYRYDWDSLLVHTSSRSSRRPNEERSRTMSITPQSMDPVSLYFNLRSVDLDSFREGEVRELQMVLEDTIRTLKYRYIAREVRRVPQVGKFNTLKFACTIGSSEEFSFTDGSEFFIWISEDENKIPVFLESPIRVGSVRAYLSDWSGLKYPLSSKIR